jgi:hypothetical protein
MYIQQAVNDAERALDELGIDASAGEGRSVTGG